ncbi:MAG: sugar ABC transporter ATP-binding protein [Propionibacteriaceae bacterium]
MSSTQPGSGGRSATELLAAREIAKSYGPVVALRSVDLTVNAGEAHALLGANGAGKSTLVKIITGVIQQNSGSLDVSGKPVERLRSPADGLELGIASVFQDPAMIGGLTVRQNLRLTGTPIDRVESELTTLQLDGLDLDERVEDIPLPFLRMLDLARALAHDPTLLILDEITAALPTDLAAKVFEVLARLVAEDRSVLFISHRLEEVITHCTMCTVFRDGMAVDTFVPSDGGEQRIVQSMLGDTADIVRVQGRRSSGTHTSEEPNLVLTDISTGRDLEDVSLSARPGEVLGLVALEGQGQDALFEVMSGNRRPDGGRVEARGRELRARHPADAIARGVVLVPADRVTALLPQRTIRENIALPMRRSITSWGPIRLRRENGLINKAIERLSIDTRAAAQARRLSGGNQQKLTIARWLAEGFSTLLLFDPTRGIDIGTKHQIYDLVREVADDGAAVVMYTSELREVQLVCDRVLVLYGGRIVGEFSPDTDEEVLLSAAHGFVHAEEAS